MILTKRFDAEKLKTMRDNFPDVTKRAMFENDKMTFESEDSVLLDFVANNFEDYVEPELRLDALEAQIIGEQSMFSKIREKVGL